MTTLFRRTGLAWALALLPLAAARGQSRVELATLIGLYAPLGSFAHGAYATTGLPRNPADLSGLALSAAGRVWLTSRMGLQVDAMVARSGVGGGATPGGIKPTTPARVVLGSAQLLYRVSPAQGPMRVWLGAGPAVVRHAGTAYASYGNPTSLAAVFALGSTVPLASRVSLTFSLAGAAYGFALRDSAGTRLEHGAQFDALLQGGISWRLH